MKITKPFLVLASGFLLLASCGETNQNSSSNPPPFTDSSTTSLTQSSDPAPGPGTSSEEIPTSESTPTSDTQTSSPEDTPTEHAISLQEEEGSTGMILTAPKTAMSGETVALGVELEAEHIIEAIRLYYEGAPEKGVRVQPNAEGVYEFQMPKADVRIGYKAVRGYRVTFESDYATAGLAEDSAEFDLFGEGYPVYVKKLTVDENYAFSGFTVKTETGETIETWDDRVDQVGFLMPKGHVIVTAHAIPIDEAFVAISGTYTGGVQIDLNEASSDFELQIDVSGRLTFKTDWTDPYWSGMATFDGTTLTGDLTHLSQDGYYGGETRRFTATFTPDKRFFSAEFATIEGAPSTYHYVFAKPTERLKAKKLYRSEFIGGNYALAERIYAFSAVSGDFFTYVNPDRTVAKYFLHAYEFGVENEVFSFLANKHYALKDASGKTALTLHYDGSLVSIGGDEAGTYSCAGQPELSLDGFGNYTLGEESGTYVVSGLDITLSASGKTLTIDKENGTYALGGSPVLPDVPAHAFSGKRYGTSTTSPIRFYDEYGESSNSYQLIIAFGKADGAIDSIELVRLEQDAWNPIGNEYKESANLSYVYDEATQEIRASFAGTNATLIYQPKNDTIAYRGTLWNCAQGEMQINNKNQTLAVLP